jgi:uncharacterized protein YgiM (DUF1202 family)
MTKIAMNGRWAAFTGLAMAGATTLVVTMAGPAMADDHSDNGDSGSKEKATSCTEQVRVRSQPSITAPVIGSCKAGEKVTVDKTENGFAYLVNKSGWASTDYLGLDDNKSDDNKSDDKNDDNSDSDNNDDSDNHDDNHDDGGLGL